MKGLDRSKYNIYIPAENRGEAIYDSSFDLQPAAAQDAFLDACDTIRNYKCEESGCQFGLLIRPNTTTCFLEEFQTWHEKAYGETTYDCTADEFYERLTDFRETTTPKADPCVYHRPPPPAAPPTPLPLPPPHSGTATGRQRSA